MLNKKTILIFLVSITICYSQNFINERLDDYSDVLLIINQNSSISDSVGSYFAQSRNIPEANIVRVDVPTAEEIDSSTFNFLRSQIENFIIAHNLLNQINYIVTTKGVPLKVNRGNTMSTTSPSSSVESELTLMFSQYSDKIGRNGYVISPYFLKEEKFSRSKYGIFLVTRLDGYNFQDIKNLIDKSAQYLWIDSTMQFIFDQDPTWNSSVPYLNNSLAYTHNILTAKGLNSYLDNTTTFLTNKTNVIGYASFGSNDYNANLYTQYAKPNNTWAPGAIAETYVSTSGRTFNKPVIYGQSLIADLIAEGISGAKGYVYEPYSNALALVHHLFKMYTDGYNLAESFYSASRALSWMDVVVGDPKMRIFTPRTKITNFFANRIANSLNVQISWIAPVQYKNVSFILERKLDAPNTELNTWKSVCIISGAGTTIFPQLYTFTDKKVKSGNYLYRLTIVDSANNYIVTDPISLNIYRTPGLSPETDDEIENTPHKLEKTTASNKNISNFPNPFNPSTVIIFKTEESGNVKLTIYNSLGQLITTLVDGYYDAGVYSINFSAADLPAGVYFSRLETPKTLETNKMILMK